jgi:hypothetical protein
MTRLRFRRSALPVLVLIAALAAPRGAAALALDQIDSFEDGTTQGWINNLLGMGGGAPAPTNATSGGPGGPDDNYLLVTSTGSGGAGGRLVALNPAQWAGDYTAAGVIAIAMHVRNLGQSDLALRLLFEDPTLGPPANVAFSTDAIPLAASGDWTHVVFPIAPGDLTALDGTVEAALAGATVLRIFHGSAPTFPPDPVVAQLGVDNIRAVPAPGAGASLALALAALASRRHRS